MAAVVLITMVAMACDPPSLISTPTYTIKNSLWDDVTPTFRAARDLTEGDLEAYVEEYNATHFDDFLRIYEGDAPGLDSAPNVTVYVCNPVTHDVNSKWEDIPRRQLVDNATAWKAGFAGQDLYIDHVPPAPIVTPPASMYGHYAIYLVDNNGSVVLEDHCGYLPDETFTGQWITVPEAQGGGGWASVDAYFDTIVRSYTAETWRDGWRVITRQLYTAP